MSMALICKKNILFVCCVIFSLWTGLSYAQNIDACDYDTVLIGAGSIEVKKDTFSLEMSDMAGNGIRREGPASHPVVGMLQHAVKHAEVNPESNQKEFAVLMSLNEPVCAVNFQQKELFVGGYVEKDAHYAVTVCIPESSSCWTMKINKNSALGGEIRAYGMERAPSGLCGIVFTAQNVILTAYKP